MVMSSDRNQETMQKMVAHHRVMATELGERVDRLAGSLDAGAGTAAGNAPAELEAIRSYLDTELLPHARAEEAVVYPAAAAAGMEELVTAMVGEHRLIIERAGRLSAAEASGEALATARSIVALFTEHAGKENTLILPPLAADPGVDLAALLKGLEDVLAG